MALFKRGWTDWIIIDYVGRNLHVCVRSRTERELRGLFTDPQDACLSREHTLAGSHGAFIYDVPNEGPRHHHYR